jgi:two-component sensor histidine kinase
MTKSEINDALVTYKSNFNSNYELESALDKAYSARYSNINSSFAVAENCLQWSIKKKYASGIHGSNSLLALLHVLKGNLSESVNLIDKLLVKSEFLEDKHLARSFYATGIVLRRIGKPTQAQMCFQRSLEHYYNIEDECGICLSNNALAYIQISLNNFYQANGILKSNDDYLDKINNPYISSTTLLFQAKCYMSVGEKSKAIKLLEIAKRIKIDINDICGLAGIFQVFFEIAINDNEVMKAEMYRRKCLELIGETNDFYTKIILAKVVIENTPVNNESYLNTLESAVDLLKREGVDEFKPFFFSKMSAWHEKRRNHESALHFLKKTVASNKKNTDMNIDILSGLKNVTNLLSQEKQIKEILEKHNRKLMTSQKEKTILLKEINHRVRNNLQIIISLIKYNSPNGRDWLGKEDYYNNDKLLGRINVIAYAHEHMTSIKKMQDFNLKKFIDRIIDYTLTNNQKRINIRVNHDTEINTDNLDLCIPIGFIIYEALSNSINHAYPEVLGDNWVNIKISNRLGVNTINISDNGIGFKKNNSSDRNPFGGLSLIENFTSDLNGSLDIKSKPGTTINIIF